MSNIKHSLVVVLSLVALSGPAFADLQLRETDAKEDFESGMESYKAGDFGEALELFQSAYSTDPRPELLFAMAQAARLDGQCKVAMPLYDRFIATGPSATQVSAAKQQRQLCAQLKVTYQPIKAVVFVPSFDRGPTSSSHQVGSTRAAVERDDQPWYSDAFGDVLLGSSLVTAAVGTWLLVDASKAAGPTYGDFQKDLDRSNSRRTYGYITVGAAGVLALGAVIRYATAGDDDDDSVAITGSVGGDASATLGLTGRF